MSKSFESIFQGSSVAYIDYSKFTDEVQNKVQEQFVELASKTSDESISQEDAKALIEKLAYEMYKATLNLALVAHGIELSNSEDAKKALNITHLMLQDSYNLSMTACREQAERVKSLRGG